MSKDQAISNQMREAKALILDMMDNLQTALREKDEAVKNTNDMRQALAKRTEELEEMKKEKDEFFHKMEKQLEESEKRREIAELKKEREVCCFILTLFVLLVVKMPPYCVEVELGFQSSVVNPKPNNYSEQSQEMNTAQRANQNLK